MDKKVIAMIIVGALLALFIVNDFILEEPLWTNQVTVEDTTQKGN